MDFKTDGGEVRSTDYFSSGERLKGRAWLMVIHTTWHFFLPQTCGAGVKLAQVYPIEAEEEPEGWMWCLDLDGVTYPLPLRQIQGPRPRLPDLGQVLRRSCLLHTDYCAKLGPWFFGAIQVGMQSHGRTLYVARDRRLKIVS
ncbi:hypothetical protein [Prosthecobacter dejongeii]|uniref:Uncharacterized protein n=1 Tax=Prosthecobacter dejongeii TaxID=48465 RepID=A0A7W7YLR9_9BACT|nr:hypothetical protein [Prosthecobacter dejongeii]MBB5038280.1 hypothetical protein [Prosthecobacter dejongeii]